MSERKAWYSARLLFEAMPSGDEALFEERVFVLRAPEDEQAALSSARVLGKQSENCYENAQGASVTWVFREVLDIIQLPETPLREGSEVYHHYLTAEEVEQVRKSLRAASL